MPSMFLGSSLEVNTHAVRETQGQNLTKRGPGTTRHVELQLIFEEVAILSPVAFNAASISLRGVLENAMAWVVGWMTFRM